MFHHLPSVKDVIDGISVGTALATLAGWLPVLAALASLIWTLIRIYDRFKKGRSDES